MRYGEFKARLMDALHDSGLPSYGQQELLDPAQMERRFEVYVSPIGGGRAPPFGVGATVSFRWDALLSARSATSEEDVLTALHGRSDEDDGTSEPPYLRVDITLRAYVDLDRRVPLAAVRARADWVHELRTRLADIEPIIPAETVQETPDGMLAVLAWQGEPELTVECTTGGALRLRRASLAAFQILDLPRQWSDFDRDPDIDPDEHLAALFQRLRAALHAWGETLDHLR